MGVGGVTWGASQYFETYPIHIPGLWKKKKKKKKKKKNGPIYILDRPKCWPIHILPFDFYTILLLVVRQISQLVHWIPREQAAFKKYLSKNIGIYWYVRKVGPSTYKSRKIGSVILFVEKRGLIIYLVALKKKGAIRHAHPYYAIYRKLTAPRRPPAQTPFPGVSSGSKLSAQVQTFLMLFRNPLHSYTWPLKKLRTHSYTWSSEMLTYSYTACLWFLYPFIGKTNIAVNSLNVKRTSSLEKIYERKLRIYPDVRKVGPFTYESRKIGSVRYFFDENWD